MPDYTIVNLLDIFYVGSAADQKEQTCSLIDPVSEEARFLPACIPAPLEAPLDMSPPP